MQTGNHVDLVLFVQILWVTVCCAGTFSAGFAEEKEGKPDLFKKNNVKKTLLVVGIRSVFLRT